MNRRRFMEIGATAAAGVVLGDPLGRAGFGRRWFERAEPMMGSFLSLAVESVSADEAEEHMTTAFDAARSVVADISEWEAGSVTTALNERRSMRLSSTPPAFRRLMSSAEELERRAGGRFSACASDLTALWRDARERLAIPSCADVRRAAVEAIASRLETSAGSLRITGCSRLELGGIGKGLVADVVRDVLVSRGVMTARVAASGDIRFAGPGPWTVDIEHPRAETILGAVTLNGPCGIGTSGDYRAFAEIGGRRYHHLLDVRSGYPANHWQSVTVAASTAALADGLATAAFVMPPAEALSFLERQAIAAVLVTNDGTIASTARTAFRPAPASG